VGAAEEVGGCDHRCERRCLCAVQYSAVQCSAGNFAQHTAHSRHSARSSSAAARRFRLMPVSAASTCCRPHNRRGAQAARAGQLPSTRAGGAGRRAARAARAGRRRRERRHRQHQRWYSHASTGQGRRCKARPKSWQWWLAAASHSGSAAASTCRLAQFLRPRPAKQPGRNPLSASPPARRSYSRWRRHAEGRLIGISASRLHPSAAINLACASLQICTGARSTQADEMKHCSPVLQCVCVCVCVCVCGCLC
jgi:hypothetical protein